MHLLRKVEVSNVAEVLDFPLTDTAVPTNVLRKVPLRKRNDHYRSREHLTEDEVNAMLAGVSGRYPKRDKLLILMAYRHGLRVTELINLRWSDVDFKNARLVYTYDG